MFGKNKVCKNILNEQMFTVNYGKMIHQGSFFVLPNLTLPFKQR